MTTEAAQPADSESLSVSEAVAVLRTAPADTPAVEPEDAPAEDDDTPADDAAPEDGDVDDDDPNSEGEPTPEDETEPADEPTIGDEDEDPSEPAEPTIAAPQSWDDKSKAAFAKAPPEVQQAILARETERDTATKQALEHAAEARKAANAQVESLSKVAAEAEAILPKLKAQFADEFADTDWEAEAEEDPEGTSVKWIKFQAQQARIKTLDATKAAADAAEETAHIATQRELMAKHAPLLVHPEFGQRLQADLSDYLVKNGEEPESVRLITATRAGVALKAMLYDQAVEAASKAAKAPKGPATPPSPKPAAPSRPAVRPSASPTAVSPRESSRIAAERRLDREGTVEAGVAALRASRPKGR